jgi:hypothetical protein
VKNSSKLIRWVLALLVASAGAYWYWSPHVALYQMAKAAQARDADAFNDHVDYLRLRESIKGQISAKMGAQMAADRDHANPFSALGTMLGMAMVGNMVDAMVRPEVVMYAMRNDGHLNPEKAAESKSPSASASTSAAPSERTKWAMERKGMNKVLVYPGEDDVGKAKAAKSPVAVLERTGFATWKLTELRIIND